MTLAKETKYEHIGETRGCQDHDHDLVHEMSRRLDAMWRYDQYIANADGHSELQDFWREVKSQETGNIQKIKELMQQEIEKGCF
ncbi:MAG: hypothetical protein COA78_32135 [Blastopirellula sp.]|nr:MAG: hypothetical protein COA78_32135 [Blastopirellula sp.]